jgi:hypothetical protein
MSYEFKENGDVMFKPRGRFSKPMLIGLIKDRKFKRLAPVNKIRNDGHNIGYVQSVAALRAATLGLIGP